MLTQPTFDKLAALRLQGMAKALAEQLEMTDIDQLDFTARLGLLVDREMTERDNRRLQYHLAKARFRQAAAVEDIDFRTPRGLDRQLFAALCSCQWVRDHQNILITGATGLGKSFLACALGHKACREGFTALYHRLPRLLPDLAIAKADGRYGKLLAALGRTDVLLLDDWGVLALNDGHRHDLLEILEDRYDRRSTIVTSQLPVSSWHEAIGHPTLADAILDRLVHNAHRVTLKGKESIRKTKAVTPHAESGE